MSSVLKKVDSVSQVIIHARKAGPEVLYKIVRLVRNADSELVTHHHVLQIRTAHQEKSVKTQAV